MIGGISLGHIALPWIGFGRCLDLETGAVSTHSGKVRSRYCCTTFLRVFDLPIPLAAE